MKKALGMIEIVGLSTAIFVADIMIKTANVEIIDIENTRGLGYMTVKIAGDVGAVNAAISAGKIKAISYGNYVSSVVIARPHDEMYYKLIKFKEDNKAVQEKIDEKEAEVEVLELEETSFNDEKEEIVEVATDFTEDEDTFKSGSDEDILEEVEKYDTKKSKSSKKTKSNKKK